MAAFLIGLGTVVAILIGVFLMLIVLMQRASTSGGLGSAMGGGMAESALGAESGNVLTRWTIYGAVAFFVLTFCLYLGYMSKIDEFQGNSNGTLPQLQEVEAAKSSGLTDLGEESVE